MSVSVRRWTQRRLLYPLAVFAIIAPTVVMGLFGTYALREIELRPSSYREQLHAARTGAGKVFEQRLLELGVTPPRDVEDVERARAEVERYFLDYNRAVASTAFVGIEGRVHFALSVDAEPVKSTPPVLESAVQELPSGGQSLVTRRVLSAESLQDGALNQRSYVLWADGASGGFIGWELAPNVLDRLARDYVRELDLHNSDLKLDITEAASFEWNPAARGQFEVLGFVPVHDTLLPDRFFVLKVDATNQFRKDNKLLSTIFIVIAVLCVPIVASATLMVVHMILREASEARKKVDFVSNVTHELKTPLTSIRMFVETLKLGRVKEPEKVQACLDTIMSETQRLSTLIDHVLSFSKVENQVKKVNIQANDIAQVCVDTINFFRGQAPHMRDRVQRHILPGLPAQALFDKDAIREVLLNLLTNAAKYSPENKPISVTVGPGEKEIFIEVQDQGIGIDPENHQRIFEKFFRVDQELTRDVDGTGLGLAICAEIVKAHGGHITVDSQLGRGSTFTVYLPWRPVRFYEGRRKPARLNAPRDTAVRAAPATESSPAQPTVAVDSEPALPADTTPETGNRPKSEPAAARLPVVFLALALAVAGAHAQPELEDDEQPPPEPKGSLIQRMETDTAAEQWVRGLGGLRPIAVAVEEGVILAHALSPEGDRLYYYRALPAADKTPTRYALYTVGPEKPEQRLFETGGAREPPLFLPDGRMLVTQRRHDSNEDGEIDLMDDGELVACNRDGGSLRGVASLGPGQTPVAVWRGGTEVLISEPGDEANGWISSLHLVRGTSARVTRAFNVALVLEGDKLLIERLQPLQHRQQPTRFNRWGENEPEETEPEERPGTLNEPVEYLVFDPADSSLTPLHSAGTHSRIVCTGERSYFGHQLGQASNVRGAIFPGQVQSTGISEILIVDDPQHRDTRTQAARHDHFALAWVPERGLLAAQQANLRSQLLLLDRALNWHTIGQLDLAARGICASADGRRVAWLEVEDTDENGALEPWLDRSRPFFAVIE